ncbi:MAG TPA: hypothetical protein VFJ07_19470 [Streptosporangiaceae bacterium]|nr:hypothetical protein [Streptosporangiaceae bacterium]
MHKHGRRPGAAGRAQSAGAWPHAAAAIATLTTVVAATPMTVGVFAGLSEARTRRSRY